MSWMDQHPFLTFFLTIALFATTYDLGMEALDRFRRKP